MDDMEIIDFLQQMARNSNENPLDEPWVRDFLARMTEQGIGPDKAPDMLKLSILKRRASEELTQEEERRKAAQEAAEQAQLEQTPGFGLF